MNGGERDPLGIADLDWLEDRMRNGATAAERIEAAELILALAELELEELDDE